MTESSVKSFEDVYFHAVNWLLYDLQGSEVFIGLCFECPMFLEELRQMAVQSVSKDCQTENNHLGEFFRDWAEILCDEDLDRVTEEMELLGAYNP